MGLVGMCVSALLTAIAAAAAAAAAAVISYPFFGDPFCSGLWVWALGLGFLGKQGQERGWYVGGICMILKCDVITHLTFLPHIFSHSPSLSS